MDLLLPSPGERRREVPRTHRIVRQLFLLLWLRVAGRSRVRHSRLAPPTAGAQRALGPARSRRIVSTAHFDNYNLGAV